MLEVAGLSKHFIGLFLFDIKFGRVYAFGKKCTWFLHGVHQTKLNGRCSTRCYIRGPPAQAQYISVHSRFNCFKIKRFFHLKFF